MKKKILGLLLCAAMLLSLMPTTAFADDEIPITAVEATSSDFKPPVYGEANTYYHNCHFEVTNGAQVRIPVELTKWMKVTESGGLGDYTESTFTEGTYRFVCHVRTNDIAYTLADETTVKVNGVSWTTMHGTLGKVIEYYNNNRSFYYNLTYSPYFVVTKSGTSIADLPIRATWDASCQTINGIGAEQSGFSVTKVEMAKNGTAITKATPGDTINVAFTVRLDSGYVFDDSCRAYWNGQQSAAKIPGAASDVMRFVFRVTVPEPKKYDYYIDRVQITSANKDDVLGDGTVTFLEKGEFTENYNVILLEDFNIFENSGLGYHGYDKDKTAAMYFGEDTIVVLYGDNYIGGDGAYDGIVTGEYCTLGFKGDGMLYVDVGTENTALFAPGGIVTVGDQTEINLFGYEAMDLSYTDVNVTVTNDAFLYCYAYQNQNGYDGKGLVGRGVTVRDNAVFIAECQYEGDAIFTWAEAYSANDYDITILKKGEYQNAQFSWDKKSHQPYPADKGLNTKDGVKEGDCRYIGIKVKEKTAPVTLGDVNGDGSVDSKDVLLLKRAAAGLVTLKSEQKANADVNHDGSIDSKDVLMLKRAAAGLITLK